ncbi:MAG TPA: hypothetical protein VHB48_06150 [Chitinophagaceae bacterium]|nr:hypothetical protein [Chitinophagaceae bacterium]
MSKPYFLRLTVIMAFITYSSNIIAQNPVKDYLQAPGPIVFDSINYHLVWSSHPVHNYYKHEYLPAGDTLDHFYRLVLVDVLADDSLKPKDLVLQEISGLNKRRKYDAFVDYHLVQSPDSSNYVLDFVESEGRPLISFIEWNAYLYKPFKDKNGHKGILLFGISNRSYGNNAAEFAANLPVLREKVMRLLMDYKIPEVTVPR